MQARWSPPKVPQTLMRLNNPVQLLQESKLSVPFNLSFSDKFAEGHTVLVALINTYIQASAAHCFSTHVELMRLNSVSLTKLSLTITHPANGLSRNLV